LTPAQTTTGTIQGRVADATGSVVPSAKVTIANQATGVQQTLTTNAEGSFVQPYVLPGDYTVSVEKEGFEKNVTTGVRLNVQQTVALEIALKVAMSPVQSRRERRSAIDIDVQHSDRHSE
jgi:hypothetical protein